MEFNEIKKNFRASRAPIGAMFKWSPNKSFKGFFLWENFKVFFCKTSALRNILIVKNILNRKLLLWTGFCPRAVERKC